MGIVASVGGGGHAHEKTLLAKMGFADSDRKNELHDQACQFLLQADAAIKLAGVFLANDQCDDKTLIAPRCSKKLSDSCYSNDRHTHFPAVSKFHHFAARSAHGEQMISKGEGQYRTTIGFLDVVIEIEVHRFAVGQVEFYKCDAADIPDFCEPEPVNRDSDGRDMMAWHQWNSRKARHEERQPHLRMESIRVRCGAHKCCDAASAFREEQRSKPLACDRRVIAVEVKAGRVPISDVIRQIALYRQYYCADVWTLASPWGINESEKVALGREEISHVFLGEAFREFVEQFKASPVTTSDVVF